MTSRLPPAVTPASRVRLHPLRTRRDGDEYIVGRVDTGDFVALPEIGARAVELLGSGVTLEAAASRLAHENGSDGGPEVDLPDFVTTLVDAGFVAEIDGQPVDSPPPVRPTFPRLLPRHVAWTLDPAVHAGAVAIVAAGLLLAVVGPASLPTHSDVVWADAATPTVLGLMAVSGLSLFLHELAHLCTARAVGVPSRMSWGSRLQFLVVQTDVTGIWASPRRVRATVYLAGMTVNLVLAALAVIGLNAVDPSGPGRGALAVVLYSQVLFLLYQLLIFMRTDLYFVLQDLTGCRNLYADGGRYGRFLAARLRGRPGTDPTLGMPSRERWAVRSYTPLLVIGTAACLGFMATVTLPVTVAVLDKAVDSLVAGPGWLGRLDGVAVLGPAVVHHGLWCRAWWRRHQLKLRRIWKRR